MDKTTEDLIELGRRLGRLEAENEALRKAASNVVATPEVKQPEPVKTPEPTPVPTTPSGMILELLTDQHPKEYNAHMISIELGIAKHIALDTMEELTRNGFLKKVNVGRFIAVNSRKKLERASLFGGDGEKPKPVQPTVADRYHMNKDSLTYRVLDYIESHSDRVWNSVLLMDAFPGETQFRLMNAASGLGQRGRIAVIEPGFYGALSSSKSELMEQITKIKKLEYDPLQSTIYNILGQTRRPYTIKELYNSIPPVPPNDNITTTKIERALRQLSTLGMVVSPRDGEYTKRMGPRAK